MAVKYTGAQKAAILLLAFGEEISAEIFRNMSDFEIKRIGSAMSRLGRVDDVVIDEIMREFWQILNSDQKYYFGGSEYTQKILAQMGGDAEGIMEDMALVASVNLDSLELIDPKTLATFIRNEHPQTIALILAHLDAKKCGDTLKMLPENVHTEVILRIANLESVSPEIIEEIDEILRHEVQRLGSVSVQKRGGVDPIVNMLNFLDKNTEEQILDKLEERDPDLAEQIRNLMFTFDDFVKIDDRGIQIILKDANKERLKYALKTASEAVKELIFNNMSDRARQELQEDMETMGAVKLSEVEIAQQELISIAKKLDEEGKIVIATGDAAFV